MSRRQQSLPLDQWPARDREAWLACFVPPASIFDDAPAGASLSPKTRYCWQNAYGRWLYHLQTVEPEALDLPPQERLTRERLQRFVEATGTVCKPRSVAIILRHLRDAHRLLDASDPLDWIKDIANRLEGPVHPRLPPPIDLAEVYDRAMKHLADPLPVAAKAAQVRDWRDALIVAVLCEAPVRRRNISGTDLGHQLRRGPMGWELHFAEDETKTDTALEYPLSEEVSRAIDDYIARVRPRFLGSSGHAGLWTSSRGQPLRDNAINNAVRRMAKRWFGWPLTLHDFRRAAGTLHAIKNTTQAHVARDLLGHADLRTTEQHYNLARGREAAAMLQEIVRRMRKGDLGRR